MGAQSVWASRLIFLIHEIRTRLDRYNCQRSVRDYCRDYKGRAYHVLTVAGGVCVHTSVLIYRDDLWW